MTPYTIITFSTGNKPDKIRTPLVRDTNATYLCVTDNPFLSANGWKTIYDKNLLQLSNGRDRTAAVKFNPFAYTDDEIIITMDASFQINKSLNSTISHMQGHDIGLRTHPVRTNVYDEIPLWVKSRGMSEESANRIQALIASSKLPKGNTGLYEGSLIIWKNNSLCKTIANCTLTAIKICGNDYEWCKSNQIPFSIMMNTKFNWVSALAFSNFKNVTRYIHHSDTINQEIPRTNSFVFGKPIYSAAI